MTLDIHLVEEFQHLIDESLKSTENNTNVLILKIAAPVVAAMAFEPLISIVDTYYVGQYLGKPLISLKHLDICHGVVYEFQALTNTYNM